MLAKYADHSEDEVTYISVHELALVFVGGFASFAYLCASSFVLLVTLSHCSFNHLASLSLLTFPNHVYSFSLIDSLSYHVVSSVLYVTQTRFPSLLGCKDWSN